MRIPPSGWDGIPLIDRYAESLADVPRLTTAQENALSDRYQATGDTGALDTLIKSNVRLVITIAVGMSETISVPVEDLIQAGCLGLAEGARRFRTGMGAKFSTYVSLWIKNEMRKCARGFLTVRTPRCDVASYRIARKAMEKFTREHGRPPMFDELRAILPRSIYSPSISKALGVGISSLDDMGADDDVAHIETVVVERMDRPEFLQDECQEALALMNDCLSERERQVLCWRFGLMGEEARSLSEVAAALGCTKQNADYIQMSALRKLRARLKSRAMSHEV